MFRADTVRTLVVVALLAGSIPTSSVRAPQATTPPTAVQYITQDQAIAAAVNDLEAIADGFRLRHPHHIAEFTADGIHFTPRSGDLDWVWTLTSIGAGDAPLAEVNTDRVKPIENGAYGVSYSRGGLIEQYVAQQNTIEQQFIIPQPLALGDTDLVIAGGVTSAGAFEATADGWAWRLGDRAVTLGDVRVFDASGAHLPATMTVTANATRIEIDGSALARATYPVTIDPEIGANDFRISHMGRDDMYDARLPAIAYNSTNNEYLVVWYGDDNTAPLVDQELEIFGQRINAATGAEIGSDFRISDMGPDGNVVYAAFNPDVAYNSANNQYLVVWYGDDNTTLSVENEFEIFGQHLNAATGAEIGSDFRISDMGPDGNTAYNAYSPAVAYNSTSDQYLVVWYGDDDTTPLVDEEYEIFGQRVNAATGAEIGANDFRLSDMGSDGNTAYNAYSPAVAYSSTSNQYLVVWYGEDNTAPLVDEEYEIFGQQVDGATGAEIGGDFRISDMGPDGSLAYSASMPGIAYNSVNHEYLVVWSGDDNTAPLADGEYEIFGQRINAVTGAEIGANDFRLSDMGPDGNTAYDVFVPALVYNSSPTGNQYLMVWEGDDDIIPLVDDEYEIFGQRINAATGVEIGANDFRLSDMGGDADYDAYSPAIAYNSANNEYLIVWWGDDDTGPLAAWGHEIFGQRINAATGAAVSPAFRISDMGPDGNLLYNAFEPAVAYNSTNNEYLVVWWGNDDTAPLVAWGYEIFGQRINAATGAEVGVNDFRISDMGPDGTEGYAAIDPAIAYNSVDNHYLVVWYGADNTGGMVSGENEIFGQRINAATGAEIGANDVRLSDMGPDGDANYDAYSPSIAYNSTNHEYLVVWPGNDNTSPLVDEEFEIFGQRVNAATGAEIGANDFRLSDMGPDGDINYDAGSSAVTYNSVANEYLVVWSGDDNISPLVDEEIEIFGQRVNAVTGAEIGANDFRLSDMGPDGNPNFTAVSPDVIYTSARDEYLVVWSGEDNTLPLVNDEFEIFGQRVNAVTDAEIGANDFRLSDMGPSTDINYAAFEPAVAYNNGVYIVVWRGDDNTSPLVDEEYEIFGQFYLVETTVYLPALLKNYP